MVPIDLIRDTLRKTSYVKVGFYFISLARAIPEIFRNKKIGKFITEKHD